jgi:hypothetical protein
MPLNIAKINGGIKCKPFPVLEKVNIIMWLALQMSLTTKSLKNRAFLLERLLTQCLEGQTQVRMC